MLSVLMADTGLALQAGANVVFPKNWAQFRYPACLFRVGLSAPLASITIDELSTKSKHSAYEIQSV